MKDCITALAIIGIILCLFLDLAYIVAIILRNNEDNNEDE